MSLFGRDELVSEVVLSRAPILVLVGDSMVGKSAVLEESQNRIRSSGNLAPDPVTVALSGAAIQEALLRSLSSAVAEYAQSVGRAEQVGQLILETTRRLATKGKQELAQIVGREILAFVRGQVGEDVGLALGQFIQELKASSEDSLINRITSAIDKSAATLILEFAAEVCGLVEDKEVVLAFDAAERLRDEDLRLLGDLFTEIPNSLRLHLAMATSSSREVDQVKSVTRHVPGIRQLTVGPLDQEAISEWLASEGIDEGLSSNVERLSGGYALLVGDLVSHLRQGGDLGAAPANQQFAIRTSEAWSGLSEADEPRARLLSVFRDPLSLDRIQRLFNFNVLEATAFESRLVESRIYSVMVNGRPWFHEQRRLFVVEQILSASEREFAFKSAADELEDLISNEGAQERLGEFAEAVAGAGDLIFAEEPNLRAVTEVSNAAVGVLAALVELTHPEHSPAVLGDDLLRYSLDQFSTTDDLIPALESLDAAGLVKIVTNDQDAAVVPFGWSKRTGMTIAGRASLLYPRTPIASVAQAVLNTLVLSRLGKFEMAEYGVGSASVTRLSEMAAHHRMHRPNGLVVLGDLGQNLLMSATYADRPMYGAFTFDDGDRRDDAFEALSEGPFELWGEHLAITELLKHPLDPVESQRFESAFERIDFNEADETTSFDLATEQKVAARAITRQRCSHQDRLALELTEPLRIAYWIGDSYVFQAEIFGGAEEASRLESAPDWPSNDPYSWFRLTQALRNDGPERIGRISIGPEKSQTGGALSGLFGQMTKDAVRFNEAQKTRRSITLEQEALSEAFTEFRRRQTEDANEIVDAISGPHRIGQVPKRSTFILLLLDPETAGLVPPGYSTCQYAHMPCPPGEEETVTVRITHRTESRNTPGSSNRPETLTSVFGDSVANSPLCGDAMAGRFLARQVGHDFNEVRFIYPGI